MLKPKAPEYLSVMVDLSLAGLVPGVEESRAKSRGRALESVLKKEGFDLLQTLELQVSAALPDYYLQRVAMGVPPASRSKSEGWASAPVRDCGCDFWLDLVVEQAGFRADTSLGGYKPTLTVKLGLIGALRRTQIANTTVVLRPEKTTGLMKKLQTSAVPSRDGPGPKTYEALLADGKGAARELRNAIADIATAIARETAKAAGVRAPEVQETDALVPPPLPE